MKNCSASGGLTPIFHSLLLTLYQFTTLVATVRTSYLRSVIRPTHWVTSILNIGKKMKNLSLLCLYRLLKRKPGDIYRFNAFIRQCYRFGRHDFT